MTMNRGTAITRDSFKKCAYFLSLVEGDATKGWVMAQNEWLEEAQVDPSIIPMYLSPWNIIQSEFTKAFTNYANREKAYDALGQLRMKGSDVNTYIADFRCLAKEAGVSQDDVNNLRMFAKGLPKGLCKECLVHDDPDTFEAWAMSAQNRQHIYMKEKAIFTTYGSPPPSNNRQQPQQSGWIWHRNEGSGSGGNNWHNNNPGRPQQGQGQGRPAPPRPQLRAYDENRMDTSATVRKASSDKEKEEYRKEGRCYECGKQGHLARDCPNCKNRQQQQPRARATKAEKNQTGNLIEFDDDDGSTTDTPETLSVATRVLRFSEKERDKFMDYMRRNREDLDFQHA
jgi:hypothetical protein